MDLDPQKLDFYVLMCKTVSKPLRLRIISLLGNRKMNVGDIRKSLDTPLSGLSNHLNDLYRAGILKKEKQGNHVYYYLTSPELKKGIGRMQMIFEKIALENSIVNNNK